MSPAWKMWSTSPEDVEHLGTQQAMGVGDDAEPHGARRLSPCPWQAGLAAVCAAGTAANRPGGSAAQTRTRAPRAGTSGAPAASPRAGFAAKAPTNEVASRGREPDAAREDAGPQHRRGDGAVRPPRAVFRHPGRRWPRSRTARSSSASTTCPCESSRQRAHHEPRIGIGVVRRGRESEGDVERHSALPARGPS